MPTIGPRGPPLQRPQALQERRDGACQRRGAPVGGRVEVAYHARDLHQARSCRTRAGGASPVHLQQGRATGGVAPYGFQVHRRPPSMAPGRAGNACSDHRAPRRRPLMGEGGRPAQRHRGTALVPAAAGRARAPTRSTRRANASTAPQRPRPRRHQAGRAYSASRAIRFPWAGPL